jgi:hypothetical protein
MLNSNYICCLSAESEDHLYNILDLAAYENIKFTVFREPDINNQLTAIALEPGVKSKRICADLKLALRRHN